MDELKKYLQQHADKLNPDEPRAEVWQRIQQQTAGTKKAGVAIRLTRWVAAACLLILAGIGIWFLLNESKTVQTTIAARPEKKPPIIVPEQTETAPLEKKEVSIVTKSKTSKKIKNTVTQYQPYISTEQLETLHNLETSFTQVINLQKERVSSMPMFAESPDYFNDFKLQIRQIEKDEKEIKSDISKQGMSDALLDQLINLYQQKLSVLKQLQIEMNKTNNRYKQNRGPVDSSKTYFLNM